MDLAAGVLIAAVAFSDPVDCIVQGTIYGMAGEVGWHQETCGHAIRSAQDATSVVLWSPHVWVRIKFPSSGGHQRFAYQWGKDHATVGGVVWPIEWGRANP